jgi:hypothetical protein
MRLVTALFSLLFTLLTVPSFAQAVECEALAKAAIAVAMNGKAEVKLLSSIQLDVENPATASIEKVERLLFTTGAAEITVDTLPNYYSNGQCELKSLKILRE